MLRHDPFEEDRDFRERKAVLQEGVHRDLIRGVQDDGDRLFGPDRLYARPRQGNRSRSGAKTSNPDLRRDRGRADRA